jgi:branched-chain amino acid transport system ATP-binding protein
MGKGMPLLELQQLCKDFKGLRAVQNVSVGIEKNEIFGMIGPNGSGKTTIFNLVSGIYGPTAGSIRFEGESITGLQPNQVCRRGIGRTFQITKPFLKLNVLDNVIIGALNRSESVAKAANKAREVLTQMDLEDKVDALGKELSVPQRKRLELARALATEPKLLLLDEVLAGLNPAEIKEMLGVLKGIAQRGITIFIIEHIMHAIMMISHRVMVLHHGELIAIGTPKEMAGHPKVIEAYLGEEYSFA